jgi:hypothetical protein
VAIVLALAAAMRASAAVPSPTLEGPITSPGSAFIASTSFDLSEVGYTQQEYFISGTATAYISASLLTPDGKWTVTPGSTAPYKTRILVYRPINPQKFKGTVVVEWLNVSGGVDAAPDWVTAHTELIREGAAWVGVSAQVVGVEGGPSILGLVGSRSGEPCALGSHPSTTPANIFSQTGQALRQPSGAGPLGDLRVKRLIAAGESQSASRLVTYIDAVHPVAGVYQGFLVHSRGGGGPALGAALSEAPQPVVGVPLPTFTRDDIDVPVLTVETETDLILLQYFLARQDDGPHFRLWEMAGTSHADTYTVGGTTDLGRSPDVVALTVTTSPIAGTTCDMPINSGPQHFIVNAAFAALDRWVARGKPPRPAPRLDASAGPPITIARDASGNAIGGIRKPQVDVPIDTFTGLQSGSIFCLLFGTTTPFDAARLASLYPTHRAFVFSYRKAVSQAVKSGHILQPDAKLMRRWADGSDIGG